MLQPTYPYGLSKNITTSSLVYTGPGTVSGVVVNSNSSGTLKLWDALTATTPVLFNTISFVANQLPINLFGAKFFTGLFATIAGTADITIIYNPYQG